MSTAGLSQPDAIQRTHHVVGLNDTHAEPTIPLISTRSTAMPARRNATAAVSPADHPATSAFSDRRHQWRPSFTGTMARDVSKFLRDFASRRRQVGTKCE